jgi:hypothetical protein
VPTITEEDPCAQVKANLFICYCKVDLYVDCMTGHRKSSLGGPPNAAEPQPPTE